MRKRKARNASEVRNPPASCPNLDGDEDDDDDITAKDLIKANFLAKPDHDEGRSVSNAYPSQVLILLHISLPQTILVCEFR